MHISNPQMWWSPKFEKIFSVRKFRTYVGNRRFRIFWHFFIMFLQFFTQIESRWCWVILNAFSWFFSKMMPNGNSQHVTSLTFEKMLFPAGNTGNVPKNRFFNFLEFHHFFWFLIRAFDGDWFLKRSSSFLDFIEQFLLEFGNCSSR